MLRRFCMGVALAFLAAMPVAAQYFEDGLAAYNRGDYATALKTLRPLAIEGEPRAQHYLAFMYLRGNGVEQSDTEAVAWFRRAAEQGLARSQYNLGVMYHIGIGIPQNDTEAAKWFRAAARQGHEEAEQNLVFMRTRGRLLPPPAQSHPPVATMPKRNRNKAAKAEPTAPPGAPVATNRNTTPPSAPKTVASPRSADSGDAYVPARVPLTVARVRTVQADTRLSEEAARAAATEPAAGPATANPFYVQLGSVKERAGAIREAAKLNRILKPVLEDLTVVPLRSDLGEKGIFYRLRAGPVEGWDAASALCRELVSRRQRCLVTNP